ncbi:nuclear transport factor 2 family protein [Streptomyces sp. NRRL B-1347]|uniref:nuclear transport factor 2 family protein n=1 Tax=Streptomyces sp. NRRL B-1347 TaxID=1476877 RepID=UPI0004CA1CAA|nr:nuclear transport factor 2 family protein [Streptomyces sp. NRRL B-1347]
MKPLADTTPERFIADFFTSLTESTVRGDAPESVMDRHYTPDVVQISDGVRIDRDRLLAHLRPVRKNVVGWRFDVHEAVADGGRVAARLTIHARTRKGGASVTEVHLFGEFTEDGRMRRSHQLTRSLSTEGPVGDPAGAGRP